MSKAWRNAKVKSITPKERVALSVPVEPQPLPAGRVSLDSSSNRTLGESWTLVPPSDHESLWRLSNLDTNHLDWYTPQELLYMLIDLSPEVSAAHWHFNRMCNPGYEIKAYNVGSEDVENLPAKEHCDGVVAMLKERYGSADVVINRFYTGAFLGGAVCSEIVLDEQARETIDWVSPDPYSIRFRTKNDSLRKQIWQPGQWQGRNFVPLDIPTFKYLPVDPVPASPYGRPLASPALFAAIFSLSIMHDVKRVIMQQGYKRMDISLDMEKAIDAYSFDPQNYSTFGAYVKGAIQQVETVYRTLQPDHAFVHTNIFEINDAAGTIDEDSLGAIDKIIERLEKKLTIALKSNGVVMDTSNNSNESDSNRKWEIFVAGIKSIQHLVEDMMESLLTLSCRAVGLQARIVVRFAELRASEMLRDEQTRQLRIQNANSAYQAGYTSQDEAANYAVNHDADVPEPRTSLPEVDPQDDNNDGDEALDRNSDDRLNDLIQDRLLERFSNQNGHSKEAVAISN